jgi:hypothetical protein
MRTPAGGTDPTRIFLSGVTYVYMATLTVVFRPSRAGTAVWQRWRKAFVHTQATPCMRTGAHIETAHTAGGSTLHKHTHTHTLAADENEACIGGATALSRVYRIELMWLYLQANMTKHIGTGADAHADLLCYKHSHARICCATAQPCQSQRGSRLIFSSLAGSNWHLKREARYCFKMVLDRAAARSGNMLILCMYHWQ